MKKLRIVQLILYLVVIFILIGVIILFICGRMNFASFVQTENQVLLIDKTEKMDGISTIQTDLADADIRILPGTSDSIRIKYYGPESDKNQPTISSGEGQNTLLIQQNKFVFSFFQLMTTPKVLEIYIPTNYSGTLRLGDASGDVSVETELKIKELNVDLLSGDIVLADASAESIDIQLASGDIKADKLTADSIAVDSKSGNINVEQFAGDGTVRSLSGDTTISQITGKIDITLTSGDLQVADIAGSGVFHTTSGEIDLTVSDATGDIDVASTAGDVRVRLTEKVSMDLEANTIAGDISSDFPVSFKGDNHVSGEIGKNPENQLTVSVTSGDVQILSK